MLNFRKCLPLSAAFVSTYLCWTTLSFASGVDTGIVTASKLNLREIPGHSGKIIDQLPKDSKITILENSNGWYKINYNKKSGWIYSDYVLLSKPDSATVDESKNLDSKQQEKDLIVVENNLGKFIEDTTLSIQKSEEASIAQKDVSKEAATNSASKESTVKESPSKESAVKDKPVTQSSNTVTASKEEEKKREIGTVTATSLNVREGIGTDYKIIEELLNGASVTVIGSKDGWYNVITSSGNKGWVSGNYISLRSQSSRGDDTSTDRNTSDVSQKRKDVVDYAKKLLGVKYVYGGMSPSGFDCSGYVKYVYNNFGINIERVAASQSKQGKWIEKGNLLPGDLVFFDTNGGNNYVNHVGIYIGDGDFIHASSGSKGKKVIISNLTSGFYKDAYMTGRRFIE